MDVDGDQDLDLFLGAWNPPNRTSDVPASIYLSNGSGRFTYDPNRASAPVVPESDSDLLAADLDGDGDADIVRGRANGSRGDILLNDGRGHFTIGSQLPPTHVNRLEAGDLDGDGDIDLGLFSAVGGAFASYRPYILENDGRANFTDITHRLPLPAPLGDHGVGQFIDIDEDGDLDILIPCRPYAVNANDSIFLFQFINDGRGNFSDQTIGNSPMSPGNFVQTSWLTCADFDVDGDLDVLLNDAGDIFHPRRRWSMLWNLRRQIHAPAPATVGQPWTLRIHTDPTSLVTPVAGLQVGLFDLGPLGIFGMDPATAVMGPSFVVGAGGFYDLAFQIPNDPRLAGVTLYWQCLFVENAPTRVQLSNTWEQTIR